MLWEHCLLYKEVLGWHRFITPSSAFAFLSSSDLILTSMPGFAAPSLESSSGPTRTGFCKETQIPRVHFNGRNSHPHSTSQGSPWPDSMTMCLQRASEMLLSVSPCSHPLVIWLMGLFPSPLIMGEASSYTDFLQGHSCSYLYWIVSDVVEARSFVMRIRTMLNRKMKLIWEEQGHWLVSAPPAFPPISSAMQGAKWGSQGK